MELVVLFIASSTDDNFSLDWSQVARVVDHVLVFAKLFRILWFILIYFSNVSQSFIVLLLKFASNFHIKFIIQSQISIQFLPSLFQWHNGLIRSKDHGEKDHYKNEIHVHSLAMFQHQDRIFQKLQITQKWRVFLLCCQSRLIIYSAFFRFKKILIQFQRNYQKINVQKDNLEIF